MGERVFLNHNIRYDLWHRKDEIRSRIQSSIMLYPAIDKTAFVFELDYTVVPFKLTVTSSERYRTQPGSRLEFTSLLLIVCTPRARGHVANDSSLKRPGRPLTVDDGAHVVIRCPELKVGRQLGKRIRRWKSYRPLSSHTVHCPIIVPGVTTTSRI